MNEEEVTAQAHQKPQVCAVREHLPDVQQPACAVGDHLHHHEPPVSAVGYHLLLESKKQQVREPLELTQQEFIVKAT